MESQDRYELFDKIYEEGMGEKVKRIQKVADRIERASWRRLRCPLTCKVISNIGHLTCFIVVLI